MQNVKNNEAFARINLDKLTEDDRQYYSRIMNQSWPFLEQLILTAKVFMQNVAQDTQPFAAMVRANVPELV
ncbi:hypothetical protein GCM10027341_01320 [Spirosoma knui]